MMFNLGIRAFQLDSGHIKLSILFQDKSPRGPYSKLPQLTENSSS